MRNKHLLITALAVTVLVGAGCNGSGSTTPTQPAAVAPTPATSEPSTSVPAAQPTTPSPAAKPGVTKTASVTMNEGGFTPPELTINRGTKVTFENKGSRSIWPLADKTGTGFDSKQGIAPGAAWSYTFPNAGTFGYHDKLNQFLKAKIIVH